MDHESCLQRRSRVVQLSDCLDLYIKPETLAADWCGIRLRSGIV
jgi:hypothetical protein